MKVEQMTDQLVDQIFKGLDESKLSDWEKNFIKSAKTWWTQKRKLSDKQKNALGKIWEAQNAKR